MGKRWRIHPHDAGRIALLERSVSIPPVVAQLLICRGVDDPDSARGFLEAKLNGLLEPEQLPGVPQAVQRIHSAMAAIRISLNA